MDYVHFIATAADRKPMSAQPETSASSTRVVPHQPVADDLIPRAEIARQFDVCQRTLRLWERRGAGPPAIRLGKRVYYRVDSVRSWLLAQEKRAATE